MTLLVRQQTQDVAAGEAVERLTLRYEVACAVYHTLVNRNAELSLSGDKPSKWALRAEERAFEELDSARHALFDAAMRAYPTIH